MEAELAERADRLPALRLGLVRDHEHGLDGAVPGGDDRGLAGKLGFPLRLRQLRGEAKSSLGDERRSADDHRSSAHDALDPEPLAIAEALGRTQRSGVGSRCRDRSSDRMLGRALERAGERQCLCSVDASSRDDVDERHPSGGHRARLVQQDRVHAPRRLENLRALDEDPELRATTRADEERGRRREPERARAGDDQHGDRGREGERRRFAGEEPERERPDRENEHDRHEDGGDPVREPLHRRLARLRVCDEPRDLRERRLAPDACRAHDEPAAEVDRRARDLGSRGDLDRGALAGQQRPVDCGAALDHDAVGRDLLARPNDEDRPDGELVDRDAALDPVVSDHAGLLRPELDEGTQGGTCPALRSRLEVSPGENERRHDGRDLEVESIRAVVAAGHELEAHRLGGVARTEEEQGGDRPPPRGERPDRDEGVHRRCSVSQARPGLPVERPAAPEHDGGRQREAHPLPSVELQRGNHGEHEHRKRKGGRDEQALAQLLLRLDGARHRRARGGR